jgi:hypothetical protein
MTYQLLNGKCQKQEQHGGRIGKIPKVLAKAYFYMDPKVGHDYAQIDWFSKEMRKINWQTHTKVRRWNMELPCNTATLKAARLLTIHECITNRKLQSQYT